MIKNVLLVFVGGGAGSVLRFLIGRYLNSPVSGIPYGTFLANVLGSFMIGIVLGFALKNSVSQNTILLLATGFCGGFTTFSSFAYENHLFLRAGDFTSFALYALGSIVVGFAAVFLGIWAVKLL